MSKPSIEAYRFSYQLEESCTLRQLPLELIAELGSPILGEPLDEMQKKLDAVLVGHSIRLQKDFISRYPHVDLPGLWEKLRKPHSKLNALGQEPAWALEFFNVTYWSVLPEGGKRGAGAPTLSRLCSYLGWVADKARTAVRPVQFESACGVCGAKLTVNAHSASLNRSVLNATMECPRCTHVESVARTTITRKSVPKSTFEARLRCSCRRCEEIKLSVRHAASRVAKHVDAGVEELAQWMLGNGKDLVPMPFESALGKEGIEKMRLLERDLVDAACTLSEAIVRRLKEQGCPAVLAYVDSEVQLGISHGYLRAGNVRVIRPKRALLKAIREAVNASEDWGEGYSLDAYIADLESGDLDRIANGCIQMYGVRIIASPVMADITYEGDVQGGLRGIAEDVLKLAELIEAGTTDPAYHVQSLKDIHQRLSRLS